MNLDNRFTRVIALWLGALLLAACGTPEQEQENAAAEVDEMDSLVSTEWLAEHLDDPNVVVLDTTVLTVPDAEGNLLSVSGRENYLAGHIPGAGFADLMGDLSDSESPYRFAVPSPEQFARAMETLGVGNGKRVVLYDSQGSMWAARVWWMLRWIGFDSAAILDGGVAAWTAAGRPLEPGEVELSPGTLMVSLRPDVIADQAEVRAAIDDDSVELIDALPVPIFTGQVSLYGRPGHIPSASNVPTRTLMDEAGRFKSEAELKTLFEGDENTRTIHYCGGGIAASATAFAMLRAGHDDVAVYTASLQEWTADPENPMATGPANAPDR